MSFIEDNFPFRTSLSLEKVIDFWVDAAADSRSAWHPQAVEVLRRLEDAPELRGPRVDPASARRHPALVRMLLSAHFPATTQDAYGSAGAPFSFETIFFTDGCERLGVLSEEALFTGTRYGPEMVAHGMLMAGYEHVLLYLYGIDVDFDAPLVVTIADPDTGLQRHFQLVWDPQFMTVTARKGARRATPEELDRLLSDPMDFELWSRVLPPEDYELGGLGVSWAVEVTAPEANSLLREGLLREDALASAARLDEMQTHVRTLLGRSDIELGLIAFHRDGGIDTMDRAAPVGRSLLMRNGSAPECPLRGSSSYAEALETTEALVIRNLKGCRYETGYEHALMQGGIRSLALLPLSADGRRIGLLEVGSPTPGAITLYQALKLDAVTEAFATALQRSIAGREDRLRAVIKQRYTSIHPSVEWRFRDAAAHILGAEGQDEAASTEEIVFPDVYPLYGLTDIRGSSEARARAIQADLNSQVDAARAVVAGAAAARRIPALDELSYRLGRLSERVGSGMVSDDETAVLAFLASEVEPLMEQLAEFDPAVAENVEAYRESLDPELGIIYRERRGFESSVARFNEIVGAAIDREQAVVQEVFPHYFERFKTDGVDYNVYVGDSIAERGGFNVLYLRNLRLWQLQLASRIQWALDDARSEFEAELPATHLVLVQDHPLAIRFRVDEKRFDVDGAYNIRYELVKKRIDKARILSTGERLTGPGTLAVVYSQQREAEEYRRYLEFLIEEGFFEGEIEEYELEDMQGVHGLRAFRVAIPARGTAATETPPRRPRLTDARRLAPTLSPPTG